MFLPFTQQGSYPDKENRVRKKNKKIKKEKNKKREAFIPLPITTF